MGTKKNGKNHGKENDRYGTILLVVFTCQTHTCSTCTLVFILTPTLDKAQRMSAWEASLYCHLTLLLPRVPKIKIQEKSQI